MNNVIIVKINVVIIQNPFRSSSYQNLKIHFRNIHQLKTTFLNFDYYELFTGETIWKEASVMPMYESMTYLKGVDQGIIKNLYQKK